MDLAKKIKELRQNKSWSINSISKKIGVSPSTYREWELGRKIPIHYILKIAEVHSISSSNLLGQKQVSNEELAQAIQKIEEGLAHIKRALTYL